MGKSEDFKEALVKGIFKAFIIAALLVTAYIIVRAVIIVVNPLFQMIS